MVPNHPRYQLRYTRLFDFAVLLLFRPSMVGHVVKCCAGETVRGENARVFKAFRASVLGTVEPKSMLPNHARYQLRYTRISRSLSFSIILYTTKHVGASAFSEKRQEPGTPGLSAPRGHSRRPL